MEFCDYFVTVEKSKSKQSDCMYLNVVVSNMGGCVLQLLGREPAAPADHPEETSTYDVDIKNQDC